jgi:hypothetical protein
MKSSDENDYNYNCDDDYDDIDYLHIESKFKPGRLPKNEYDMISTQRKSEQSCHKKKNGVQKSTGLVYSRDEFGNVLCAGCLKVIIPKKSVTNDDIFYDMIDEFEKDGGISNCCYDCEFSWYCNKCSLITIYSNTKRITCGKSLMRQLLKPEYGAGKFSFDREADYWVYLRKFFEKDMKHKNSLKGKIVDVETIRKIYNDPNAERVIVMYKSHIKKSRKEMTSLDDLYARLCSFDLLK